MNFSFSAWRIDENLASIYFFQIEHKNYMIFLLSFGKKIIQAYEFQNTHTQPTYGNL